MKSSKASLLALGLALLGVRVCLAQQAGVTSTGAAAPTSASPQPSDRLTISGDGATLTNTNGGGGGAATGGGGAGGKQIPPWRSRASSE